MYFAAHAWQQLQWSCVCLTGLAPKNVLAIPSVIPSSWELLLQGDAGKCLHAVTHMHVWENACKVEGMRQPRKVLPECWPLHSGCWGMHVQLWRALFHKLHLQCKNNLTCNPQKPCPPRCCVRRRMPALNARACSNMYDVCVRN